MRVLVITVALASLMIPAVMADPAPPQTPAELQQSAPAAPAPGMTSLPAKAAATEVGKAQTTAQLAAQTPVDNGHNDGGAAKDATSLEAGTAVDNGRNDGGAAQ